MKVPSILMGCLSALCWCSIITKSSNVNLDNALALDNFTDELILFCLSFIPASFIAKASTVSTRFSTLCCTTLDHLFIDDQTQKLNPSKIFQYYHEVEPSAPIKALNLQVLETGRPASLSCESFKMNNMITFFMDYLYSDRPVIIGEATEVYNHELFHLMTRYKDTALWRLSFPTEILIDAVGYDKLEPIWQSRVVDDVFFKNAEFLYGTRETRKKFYKLYHRNASRTFQVLVETEDLFDSRLSPNEIDALELVVLADLSNEEKSLKRALELASVYMRSVFSFRQSFALQCIHNTAFVIGILRIRRLSSEEQLMLILILYLRKDAKEIFSGINDVELIQNSIRIGDDKIHPILKMVYGILFEVEDDVLILLIGMLNEGVDLFGFIAAYHQRSPALLLALKSDNGYLQHISPRSFTGIERITKSYYVTYDCDLEQAVELLRDGHLSPYWQFFPFKKRLEVFEHILDNASDIDVVPILEVLDFCAAGICSDSLFRKFIKRSITCGLGKILAGNSDVMTPLLEREIEKEVVPCLRHGAYSTKMFRLFSGQTQLNQIKKIVFREVFDTALKHICSHEEIQVENAARKLIKICLANKIEFQLPEEFKNLVTVSVMETIAESPDHDMSWLLTFMDANK